MSKKNLLSTRVSHSGKGRVLAFSLLMLGCASTVRATTPVPTSPSYPNFSISFTGGGTIPVSLSTYGLGTSYNPGFDPAATVSLTGTGSYNLSSVALDGYGGVYFSSSISATATMTIPSGDPTPSTFSITAPKIGTDPGLNLSTYIDVIPTADTPFGGLYPPPAGTDYSATIATTVGHDFYYPSNPLSVAFNGQADLIFGNALTETAVPDPSDPGNDLYTFSYAGSSLDLDGTIGLADPPADFTGIITITTDAAPFVSGSVPDSAPGLVGVLTLAGVCVAGRRLQKARMA